MAVTHKALASGLDERRARESLGWRVLEWLDLQMPIVFNIPTVVFLFGLVAVPIALVLATSFTDWQLVTKPDPDFVGFENYVKPWSDERWIGAIWHTFAYAVASVGGQFVLGLATAMLFNRSFAGRRSTVRCG